MKRTNLLLTGAVMCLSTFMACTNESDEMLSDELREIVATADHFVPEADSRAFSFVNNSVEFAWADGDTIGIFPNTGAQAYFPIMSSSAGTNTASFTGGGWALKSSSTYAAYYPFIGNFYMNQKEIPVNYEGQKQTGNASMTHLSAFDFMAASGSTPSSGKVNFQFAHLGAFVQLKITMPQGGTLASVTLSAEEAVFTTEGTIDLTATLPAIKSVKKSKTLTLDVENVTTTAESNVATLYMMLAPVDFTNRTLSAIVKTGSGSTETITLTGKNFEAGKAYGVTGTMKDPNGGVTAGNGTYKDGVVSVDVAGNMKKLLGSDYLNITELKVVGPINGDDIYYLRKMLGSGSFSEADWGKLASLDLSEATIVEGGEWYYDKSTSSTGDEYYSENNVIGYNMFFNCANLQEIILPENVTEICSSAFSYNKVLTKVTILSGKISSSAFTYCDALTNVVMGNGVTSIGSYAFSACKSLKEVTILNGVINDGAFKMCRVLNNVIIGEGVTSIGNDSFYDCEALKSIYITNLSAWCKIDFENKEANPLYYGADLYLNGNLVTELIIPDDITTIESNTFINYKKITNVTIPAHITSIGYSAFSGCDSIESVYIADLSAWFKISNSSNPFDYGADLYLNGNLITELTIPNDVTKIGSAFSGCGSIIKVIIPDHVTSIGDSAFANCKALECVIMGSGVTTIGASAFKECSIYEFYCYATTPPKLYDYKDNYSKASFYCGVESGATLYVPARCGAAYNSSWGIFTNIIEMD